MSFFPLQKLYADKTAATLKASAMVAYPIHIVLLNVKPACLRGLINETYILQGFLPLINTYLEDGVPTDAMVPQADILRSEFEPGGDIPELIPLDYFLFATTDTCGRDSRMRLFHYALR